MLILWNKQRLLRELRYRIRKSENGLLQGECFVGEERQLLFQLLLLLFDYPYMTLARHRCPLCTNPPPSLCLLFAALGCYFSSWRECDPLQHIRELGNELIHSLLEQAKVVDKRDVIGIVFYAVVSIEGLRGCLRLPVSYLQSLCSLLISLWNIFFWAF